MSNLEMQVDELIKLTVSEEEQDQRLAREEIRRILEIATARQSCSDPEYLVHALLMEMGVPDHLVGHPYVVQAILLVVENRDFIDNITFNLYPQLAARFNTTPSRIERGIRHAIELTWTRGNLDVITHYFGNNISADKGKPTNGEFLARTANIVKLRMREAA